MDPGWQSWIFPTLVFGLFHWRVGLVWTATLLMIMAGVPLVAALVASGPGPFVFYGRILLIAAFALRGKLWAEHPAARWVVRNVEVRARALAAGALLAAAVLGAGAVALRTETPHRWAALALLAAYCAWRTLGLAHRAPHRAEPRAWTGAAALGLLSTAAGLGLIELGARFVPPPLGEYFGPWPAARFWHEPNRVHVYRDAVEPFTLATSSQRLRDREFGPKPAGGFRVLCVGDSFTAGWGVEAEESYPKQLERILREAMPGREVEVINFGVCGYGAWQELILLEDRGLGFAPDHVVVQIYPGNDLADELNRERRFLATYDPGYPEFVRWQLAIAPSRLTHALYQRSAALRLVYGPVKQWASRNLRPRFAPGGAPPRPTPADRPTWAEPALLETYPALEEAWLGIEESLAAMARICRDRGIGFTVMHAPDEFEFYPVPDEGWAAQYRLGDAGLYDFDLPERRLAAMCAQNQWGFAALKPAFREAAAGPDRLYIPQNRHFSNAGNRLAAQAAARAILAEIEELGEARGRSAN